MLSKIIHFFSSALALGALAAIVCIGGCKETTRQGTPEQLLAEGWKFYRLGEYNIALECFDTAAEKAESKSDMQLQAIYAQANTWNLRRPGEDLAKAEHFYKQIIETSPAHDLAAWSSLALARMKHIAVSCSTEIGPEPDYTVAFDSYKQCIEKYPNHPAAEEALVFQQMTLISTFNPEKTQRAADTLEKFLSEHPKTVYCSAAYGLLAYAYRTLKQPEKQLNAQIKSCEQEEIDPLNPGTDKAIVYWGVATTAEFDAGDFETARKYYRLLIEQYPSDLRVFGAKQAITRMDELEAKLRAESKQ
jgi:tetratricopeptide (TPR) repeat protein